TGLPASVEGCFDRSVNAEIHKPSGSRDGLDPPAPGTLRCGRTEMEGNFVALQVIPEFEERAQRGLALCGRNLAAGAGIVDGDGPEQVCRDRQRNFQGIAAPPVKVGAASV